MSSPRIVARTASTPIEAQVWSALLQAEGIPAHVDGTTLADELAITGGAMNLRGVHVLVPAAAAELAREVLAASPLPIEEIEAQALAAEPEPLPAVPTRRLRSAFVVAFLLAGIALPLLWAALHS